MESYLPIPGYPDYEVSDRGNVRNAKTRHVLARVTSNGYQKASIRNGGKGVMRFVHNLMLRAHVGPPPTPAHHAAHNDGTRSNNTLDNLRWATAAENQADRALHGTDLYASGDAHGSKTRPERTARGERIGNATLTEAEVRAIRIDTRKQRAIARSYGVSPATICRVIKRVSWEHVT